MRSINALELYDHIVSLQHSHACEAAVRGDDPETIDEDDGDDDKDYDGGETVDDDTFSVYRHSFWM